MNLFLISALSLMNFPQLETGSVHYGHETTVDSLEATDPYNINCVSVNETESSCLLKIESIPQNNWLLFQPEIAFWVQDILLSEDSFMVVDQMSRSVVDVIHKKEVLNIENGGNLKCLGQLYQGICFSDGDARIKFVRGRKSFFDFQKIAPYIQEGIRIFEEHKVNPIYAQLLLLIESPNNSHAVSIAGARGHFQLMPDVARKYGLRVNRYTDERVNFQRSAMAAAKLFKYYCIPSARRICENLELDYKETDLWFQLLTLHIYNAGAGNVKKAALLHKGVEDGNSLITSLWHTRKGAFGNSSQNYSQLCLASYRCYKEYFEHLSATIVTNDPKNDIQ